jgi:hypothetical protein
MLAYVGIVPHRRGLCSNYQSRVCGQLGNVAVMQIQGNNAISDEDGHTSKQIHNKINQSTQLT